MGRSRPYRPSAPARPVIYRSTNRPRGRQAQTRVLRWDLRRECRAFDLLGQHSNRCDQRSLIKRPDVARCERLIRSGGVYQGFRGRLLNVQPRISWGDDPRCACFPGTRAQRDAEDANRFLRSAIHSVTSVLSTVTSVLSTQSARNQEVHTLLHNSRTASRARASRD